MKKRLAIAFIVSFGVLLAIVLLVPLIASGADRNPTQALMKSLAEGTASPQSVKAQLAAGADPKWTQAFSRQTLLMLAADGWKFNPDTLDDSSKEADAARDRWNAVSPEICTLLIEAGCDVNARGRDGITPLAMSTTLDCQPEVTKVLLANGADPNPEGVKADKMPLFLSVLSGCPKTAELLIKAGARIPDQTPDGTKSFLKFAEDNTKFAGTPALDAIKAAKAPAASSAK
ncbi:MAG: ankyrin repeat domain-containing protein [Planctomycetota bacterium]|nr:ankyrin repeat domain-containing protein [Planctomycetota bacterium]